MNVKGKRKAEWGQCLVFEVFPPLQSIFVDKYESVLILCANPTPIG